MSSTISQYSPNKIQNQSQSKQTSLSPNRIQKDIFNQSPPQRSNMNQFDRSYLKNNSTFQQSQQSQPQMQSNPLQIVNAQARRIEELQIEVEFLKQRECVQLSAEEKNQLISDLYTQIEQKNILIQRQNDMISSFERQVLDSNARVRILEIDQEQYMIELKQYKDELMLQNSRNQSLQSNLNELRKSYEEMQGEKAQMSDQFRKQFSEAIEENLILKSAINELELKNNQAANELNNALDQIISEKAQQELLKKQVTQAQTQQQQQQQQMQMQQQNRKHSIDDDTQMFNNVSASYNNQSFLLDDFHANTINISMTSECLSEKMKRYCNELDSFIEKFLENKKFRVRSKQEMKFFSEMGKMIQFLKNKHLKMSDEFKEQVEMMNKKTEETRVQMISTLAHVRILKQSTEITITDLEKAVENLKEQRERNLKKLEEQDKKLKEQDKEMTELKKKMNQQTVKIQELTELSNQRQKQIQDQEKKIQELNAKIKILNEQIESINIQFKQKENEYIKQRNELNEQISNHLSTIEDLKSQIEELQYDQKNNVAQIEELTENLQRLSQERENEKLEFEQIIEENKIDIFNKSKQIESQLEQIEEQESKIKILSNDGNNQGEEVIRLNQVIKEMQAQEYNLQEDVRTCKRKIASLQSKQEDRQELEDQIQNLQSEIAQLKEQSEQQNEQIDVQKKINSDLEHQFVELQEQSITSEHELSVIKEKIPLVDEEMKQLIDLKDKSTQQINQLKTLILQMESKILMHETKIKEQEEELEQKQVLVQMLKVELEQIDNLHQESLLHEKVFYVKKQEEYEKTIFNLIEENKQLQIQRQTLNTSINYLNKIENFFENDNQGYQDQKLQIQKQNKKIKVLVSELDTQIKEKQVLEKRVSELETYINLIIENSVEYNSNNDNKILELKQALFSTGRQNNNTFKLPEYYLDKENIQTYNINLNSHNSNALQSYNIDGNHNTFDSNGIM